MKEKEDSPEGVLNEIQASKLPNTEFKIIVIRMLNELSENYTDFHGSCEELTGNYNSMKKDIENINKSEEEMKNTISEMKNTLERIKNKVDEAED